MPLTLVRASANRALWDTCADRFLTEAGGRPGPRGHASHLWLTHRNRRDALLEEAHRRGIRGWLAPPISFFSELPDRLGITGRPLGLLARRRMVADLASREAGRVGIGAPRGQGLIRGHMMDSLLSDLLPEGVTPEELERLLVGLATDDFAARRNEWVVGVYRRYLADLGPDRFDPRSLHAMLAAAIEGGRLPGALGDARRLHIYGVYTLRSRRRLIESLAEQRDVDVQLYVLREDEWGEWDDLAQSLDLRTEELPAAERPEVRVQPAPDSLREYRWIAGEVKKRIADGGIEPHEIAVISRTGREDTRRACDALRAAGVPFAARQRMPLCDIGALKALLELFRGVATGWTYRTLRNVLTSPYFDIASLTPGETDERRRIDLRGIDFVATQRRVAGLEEWAGQLERLATAKEAGSERDVQRLNVWPDRLRADAVRLRAFAGTLAPLKDARSERAWVEVTLERVREGVLGLRKRACSVVGDRWEIVRFDQRGLRQLESLLTEWSELLAPSRDGAAEEALTPADWHRLLERLLEAHELALSTPRQKGVQVLEAHDAALTPFRAIFITHANDREFPQAFSSRGVLLEEELARLKAAGLPVTDRELAMRRERTLWRSVAQGDDVTVSYRTTNPEGTPLLPSLMVPIHDEARELPRTFEPIGERPVSAEEALRTAAVALRNSAEAGAGVDVPEPFPLRRAIIAAHGETMRGVRETTGEPVVRPNPWHGQLRDPAVLEELARRYGPDHVWSASQLEGYGTCPFLFLTERVLRITEADEADEDTSPMTFGGVAHDILQQFYEELIRAGLPGSFAAVQPLFERIAEEALRKREENGEWLGSPILWRFTREQVKRTVRKYLEWEVGYIAEKGERPVWCELELRTAAGEPVEMASPDLWGATQVMRFTGRVDRVDNAGSDSSPVYRVLDYKSSSVPGASGYKDGALLQAPLYMLALHTVKGTAGDRGRYRVIKKPGSPANGAEVGGGKVGVENYERALQYAFSIPGRIRAGLFEPVVAASRGWAFYHPGIEVTRTRAQLPSAPKGEDPVAWSRFGE